MDTEYGEWGKSRQCAWGQETPKRNHFPSVSQSVSRSGGTVGGLGILPSSKPLLGSCLPAGHLDLEGGMP